MLLFRLKTTGLAAIAAGLFALGAADASATSVHRVFAPHAVSSSGSWTGPAGRTWSRTGSTSCAGGTCDRTATYTGPNGRTVTTNGSASRSGPGHVNSTETVTGPNGKTLSRSGQTSCWGDACVHRGTITGPNGGTVNMVADGWR